MKITVSAALSSAVLMFTSVPAFAEGGTAAPGGQQFMSLVPLVLVFAVFYFLLIRPQQKQAKQHQAYLNGLKKGNKVITKGGIYGEIIGLTDSILTLEIAENVKIKVSRDAIAGSQVKDDPKASTGKDKKLSGG